MSRCTCVICEERHQQAAANTAAAERRRAREEKRERMVELVKALQLPLGEISYYGPSDDHAEIKYLGHRYEIREVDREGEGEGQ